MSVSIASLARLNRDAARLGGNVPRESSRRFQARQSRDCIFSRGKSHTRSGVKLSLSKSRKAPGGSAEELSKGSKVSRKPVRGSYRGSISGATGVRPASLLVILIFSVRCIKVGVLSDPHNSPALFERDLVHQRLHEVDPTTMREEQVFQQRGIQYCVAVKASSLVPNRD